MTFLGLKQGQDLENRAAHPCQKFPGVPPGEDPNRTSKVVDDIITVKTSEGKQGCLVINFSQTT